MVHAEGYGFSNLEHRTPATADTVYQSASVGKQFTAALVLMLAERGMLELDGVIAPCVAAAPAEWSGITIRHLLTHTSGISDDGFGTLNLRLDYSDDELAVTIASTPLEFAPGTAWSYSNSGYILLGLIIARITGRFYGDLLADWIFSPLGMTTARVNSEEDIIPDRAAGYRMEDGVLRNQEYVSPSLNRTADGGIVFPCWTWRNGIVACIREPSSPRRAGKKCGRPCNLPTAERSITDLVGSCRPLRRGESCITTASGKGSPVLSPGISTRV